MKKPNQSGFTLIELSIVLVIIGLIIGGVLVGQDLIKAAQIRATIQQVEQYNTEVHTFQSKYNAVPGDIQAQAASNFGMSGAYLLSGFEGDGDGNGIIEDGQLGAGGSNDNLFAGEISEFWAHLSWANLMAGGFGAGLTAGTGVPPAITGSNLSQYIPAEKLGGGLSFTIVSGSGVNSYLLLPIYAISASGVYTVQSSHLKGGSGLDPITAYNIDSKLDDGNPYTGKVRAISVLSPPIPPDSSDPTFRAFGYYAATSSPSPDGLDCLVFSPPLNYSYNTNAASGGNAPTCGLEFVFN